MLTIHNWLELCNNLLVEWGTRNKKNKENLNRVSSIELSNVDDEIDLCGLSSVTVTIK